MPHRGGAELPAPNTPLLPRLGRRFATTYIVIAAVLFSIYGFPFELFGSHRDWLTGYLEAYARLAGGVLQLFDSAVTVNGSQIDGRYALEIVRNCDAIEINILFASAILAFPARLQRRLAMLWRGFIALVTLNVARICVLYFLGVYIPTWFSIAHEEILPLILVAATALLFLWAARNLSKEPIERAAS